MNKLQTRVQQRGEGGFTLIELLVVIAILGILAGVVVFAVGNSTENAKASACKTELASLETAKAAAEAANLVNTSNGNADETIEDYLKSAPEYFTLGADKMSWTANGHTDCVFGGEEEEGENP